MRRTHSVSLLMIVALGLSAWAPWQRQLSWTREQTWPRQVAKIDCVPRGFKDQPCFAVLLYGISVVAVVMVVIWYLEVESADVCHCDRLSGGFHVVSPRCVIRSQYHTYAVNGQAIRRNAPTMAFPIASTVSSCNRRPNTWSPTGMFWASERLSGRSQSQCRSSHLQDVLTIALHLSIVIIRRRKTASFLAR